MENTPPTFTTDAFTDMIPGANQIYVVSEDLYSREEGRFLCLELRDNGELRVVQEDPNAVHPPATTVLILPELGVLHATSFCLECMDGKVIFQYNGDAWESHIEAYLGYNYGDGHDPAGDGDEDDPAGDGDEDGQGSGFRWQ